MKLITDSMLGRLARWLRISGYDVVYVAGMEDDEILEMASAEGGRVLVSRDEDLCRKAAKAGVQYVLIRSGEILDQLRQMKREAGVEFHGEPTFSRCPLCNGEVGRADKREVEGKVPEEVLDRVPEFWQCRDCGRVYWHGSHWDGIRDMVGRI